MMRELHKWPSALRFFLQNCDRLSGGFYSINRIIRREVTYILFLPARMCVKTLIDLVIGDSSVLMTCFSIQASVYKRKRNQIAIEGSLLAPYKERCVKGMAAFA